MGLFGSGDKIECSQCGKRTKQTFIDCWDADEDQPEHRRMHEKLKVMVYRRISYYDCNKCNARNSQDSWHP